MLCFARGPKWGPKMIWWWPSRVGVPTEVCCGCRLSRGKKCSIKPSWAWIGEPAFAEDTLIPQSNSEGSRKTGPFTKTCSSGFLFLHKKKKSWGIFTVLPPNLLPHSSSSFFFFWKILLAFFNPGEQREEGPEALRTHWYRRGLINQLKINTFYVVVSPLQPDRQGTELMLSLHHHPIFLPFKKKKKNLLRNKWAIKVAE